jgi:hypothetical protein
MNRYTKLALFLQEKQSQPFDWAGNNCCFFACDWLAMLTGDDPAKDYRPRITSALTAARTLEQEGGVDGIASAICEARGWRNVGVTMAQRGDIVVGVFEGADALGVCDGAHSWFAGKHGLQAISTIHQCRKAWKIT